MHRPTVGILALLLLAVGGVAVLTPAGQLARPELGAACLRIGLILGVLWLALPDIARPVNRWIALGVIAAVILIARQPKLAILAAVFLVAIAILRPRVKSYVARGK
ncbi:MAG TPA: hypothetical protein VHD36_06465 [Pirellulales bacterium]|nr:hypothetical protein [Pirellulales bacterium]